MSGITASSATMYGTRVPTTVTLDPDVEALVTRAMREHGLTFKQAVKEGVRAGMGGRQDTGEPRVPTYDLGQRLVDVTKALRLAGELEDQLLFLPFDGNVNGTELSISKVVGG